MLFILEWGEMLFGKVVKFPLRCSHVEHSGNKYPLIFQFDLPAIELSGRQQVMVHTVGSLPLMWETQSDFWAQAVLSIWERTSRGGGEMSIYLFLSAFQINKSK